MAEIGWSGLRRVFVEEYEEMRGRLTRRLGSSEAARDAMQDTFLQLTREDKGATAIRDPRRYLFRMAVNVAVSRTRTERRRLGILEMRELEAALEVPDTGPGPAEIAEDRSDAQLLRRLLEAMPPRRRAMVLAVLAEGRSHREIADEYSLSIRMVQIEMKKATDELAEAFGSARIIHFVPKQSVASMK